MSNRPTRTCTRGAKTSPYFGRRAGLAAIVAILPWLMGQGCLPSIPVNVNHPPTADAGAARTVAAEAVVVLNGSGSSDPDGGALSYAWQQLTGPSVSLTEGQTATPTFTAPQVTTPVILTFKLTVSDSGGLSDTATVQITVDEAGHVPPDTDGDGVPDSSDLCPLDPAKTAPGTCGCGIPDIDTDQDNTPDCLDGCPADPAKTAAGVCGCGVPDSDSDDDGTPDCHDGCPADPNKTAPGTCGCGRVETPGCGYLPSTTLTLDLGDGVTMDLIRIPAGTFVMGDDTTADPWLAAIARPAHTVTIAQPFYLGRYEVTQRQWRAVMGSDPAWFNDSDDLPVEYVSWEDCRAFCAALSAIVGRTIDLPTEAQWEYACRAGTATFYTFGDFGSPLGSYAWFWDNADSQTHPVGTRQANPYGLFDMYGNVWEWCQDVWHEGYAGAPADGSAWVDGGDATLRVARGGSWGHEAVDCSSPSRDRGTATHASYLIGFRVASGG